MTESDCLSFEPDQIIQVHTLHPSGWADGTLLATNERGWFPSNYCEQYTLSNLRPLLGASSLLYATVRAKRVSQYYTVISCVVTSVRGLLVHFPSRIKLITGELQCLVTRYRTSQNRTRCP